MAMGQATSFVAPALIVRCSRLAALASVAAALLLALAAGSVLAVLAPPMSAPDETFHWMRSVQISRGMPIGRKLGPNLWGGRIDNGSFLFGWWHTDHFARRQPIDPAASREASRTMAAQTEPRIADFSAAAVYSPVAYLPQAAGVLLARLGGGDLLARFGAGRIANLVVYLLLVGLLVWIAPVGGLMMAALLLGPEALHLAASHSADPLNTALPLLLAAWCLRLRLDPDAPFGIHARRGLMVLTLVMGLLKPTSFLFAAFVLLVPSARFATARERWRYAGVAFGGAFVIAVVWTLIYPFSPGVYWGSGANPRAMAASILADPLSAANFFWTTLRDWTPVWWLDGYGRFGGHPEPFSFYTTMRYGWWALFGILALAVVDTGPRRDGRAALLIAAVALAVWMAIVVAFWIGFTAPGAPTINGVQGRYLLAIWALFGLAIALVAPLGRWLRPLRLPVFAATLAVHGLVLSEAFDKWGRAWTTP